MRTLRKQWTRFGTLIGAGVTAAILLSTALWVWGQSEPLGLTIQPLGDNYFYLTITNAGVTTNRLEIKWSSDLRSDPADWPDLWVGAVGESNCVADMGDWTRGFFRASVVTYYNGIPIYELADPNNPALGRLSITIDDPLEGAVLQ